MHLSTDIYDISLSQNLGSLVVGTELDAIADTPVFSRIIQHVRKRYSGELIYAASYDHFLATSIWNDVDKIGIDAYFNLCSEAPCNMSVLVENWSKWLNIMSDFSLSKGKRIILTEIGFNSTTRCTENPGNWSLSNILDLDEQAKAYESVFLQTGYYSQIEGMFWWQWELNDVGGVSNKDYTPKGKPAENIIAKYWVQQ